MTTNDDTARAVAAATAALNDAIRADLHARLRRAFAHPQVNDPTPDEYATWSRAEREAYHDRIAAEAGVEPPKVSKPEPTPSQAFNDTIRAQGRRNRIDLQREDEHDD